MRVRRAFPAGESSAPPLTGRTRQVSARSLQLSPRRTASSGHLGLQEFAAYSLQLRGTLSSVWGSRLHCGPEALSRREPGHSPRLLPPLPPFLPLGNLPWLEARCPGLPLLHRCCPVLQLRQESEFSSCYSIMSKSKNLTYPFHLLKF